MSLLSLAQKSPKNDFMMDEFGCAQRPDRNIGRRRSGPRLPRLRRGHGANVRGLSKAIFSTKSPHTKSSNLTWAQRNNVHLAIYIYKSVNRRYAAEELALQLRALCSDHPVDGPSFDQGALRAALAFRRVVADDEPAGQLGQRSHHSLVMLDHGISVIHTFENAEAGRVISHSHHVFRVEEIDRGVIGPGHGENDVAARPN